MTEDRLQAIVEVQSKILAKLETYLRFYDNQTQQLSDLLQLATATEHSPAGSQTVRNPVSLGQAATCHLTTY